MSAMTTTGHIRVDDVTFRNGRKQSQILQEIAESRGVDVSEVGDISIPVSLTPEQVKNFYKEKSEAADNVQEKRIYNQTIQWIDEMLDLKKKVISLEKLHLASEDDGK